MRTHRLCVGLALGLLVGAAPAAQPAAAWPQLQAPDAGQVTQNAQHAPCGAAVAQQAAPLMADVDLLPPLTVALRGGSRSQTAERSWAVTGEGGEPTRLTARWRFVAP